MSLGDSFPESIKREHANRSMQIGSVLKLFVDDTRPPKEKLFIVIGLSQDGIILASVYINSEVNLVVNYSPELRALHLPISADTCDFLDYDSYVDCSQLVIRDRKIILNALFYRPEAFVGTVSNDDLEAIRKTIIDLKPSKEKSRKSSACFNESAFPPACRDRESRWNSRKNDLFHAF